MKEEREELTVENYRKVQAEISPELKVEMSSKAEKSPELSSEVQNSPELSLSEEEKSPELL